MNRFGDIRENGRESEREGPERTEKDLSRGNDLNKAIIRDAAERYFDAILPPFGTMICRGGFEAVYGLINDYGGGDFYVPTKKKVFGQCLEKDLLEKYDGTNAKRLAETYGFTIRHVKKLIKQELGR